MTDKKIVVGNIDRRKQIRRQAAKLAELLRQSPEYAQFVTARTRLEEDGENAAFLSELRQQQVTLRMAAMLGDDQYEEIKQLDSEYLMLTEEPSIRDYLFAEGRFMRLIADVEDVFSTKLDLWQMSDDDQHHAGYDIHLN